MSGRLIGSGEVRRPEDNGAATFFHPLIWQKLGGLIVHQAGASGYVGETETKGDRHVPMDCSSYQEVSRRALRVPRPRPRPY